MSTKGGTLQNYNNELVKCIEDLREKRESVNKDILRAEEEKAKIQKDLSILTDRLQRLNEDLTRKIVELETTIAAHASTSDALRKNRGELADVEVTVRRLEAIVKTKDQDGRTHK